MPDVATLTRRDGVELIRTGSWAISTGHWTASREDLAAAVAAMSCPAIRRPVLKIGHTDTRFVGDGEPAIGWVDNLRLVDGGHTLIGDYVGMPGWLDQVMASAYPDRSVEGAYGLRCQLGHTHPFALTGVALLGVTPPGVGTLKSLNSLDDVRALYGLAAGAAEPVGGYRIAASVPGTVHAAEPQHTGAMIALIPTPDDAARLAVDGGEPADELHITLAYLGEAAQLDTRTRTRIVDALRRAASDLPPVTAAAFALSVFNPPGSDVDDGKDRDTCIVLGLGGDDLDLTHGVVADTLDGFSLDLSEQHRPWVPHLTLRYTDDLTQLAALTDRVGPVRLDRVRVAFGGEVTDIPLTGDQSGVQVPNVLMPIAAASGDRGLRNYWVHGEGATKKIRWGTDGDFDRCVRHLRKYVTDPEGLCNEYHQEALGAPPGKGHVHASENPVPNPEPTLTERIHAAWNATSPPEQQWIVEAAPDEVIVMDNTDRSLLRVPVMVDGDAISFGAPVRVRPTYVPADEPVAASRMVFASAEESRPTVEPTPAPEPEPVTPPPDPEPDPEPEPTEPAPTGADPLTEQQMQLPLPDPPAAEPEPNTDPKGEDLVSTLSTDVRSRLGLDADADDATVLAALEALKSTAEAQPTQAEVAASVAARDEMKSEIERLSGELAKIHASNATTVKTSLFDAAVQTGKIKPADRESWEARYDRAPEVITEILASIAPNTAVPVAASGYTGDPDTHVTDDVPDDIGALFSTPFAAKEA